MRLKGSLPTVEELEAELGEVDLGAEAKTEDEA
jgi:hypothetical protein